MRKLRRLALPAMALLILASCKSGSSDVAIPKDAMMAMEIHPKSLKSKLSWEDIKKTEWFQSASKDASDSLARVLLNDPAASGVDTDADLAFFIQKRGNNLMLVFQGGVKDADAFAKIAGRQGTVTKNGEMSVLSNNNMFLTWNGKRFFSVTQSPNPMTMYNPGMSSSRLPQDSLNAYVAGLMKLSGDASLGSNKHFAEMMKESGDMHIWFNSGETYGGLGGAYMSMMKVNDLFDGSVSAATLNFENGKIAVRAKQYYGDKMAKLLDKFPPQEVTADLINRIPSNDVAMAMAMNCSPQSLLEIIRMTGMDGIGNAGLGKYNLTLEEIIGAWKGQALFSMSDFTVKKNDYYGMTQNKTDMKMFFAASVNNRGTFDKLVGALQKEVPANETTQVSYQVSNDWFTVGNAQEHQSAFMAGGSHKQAFADKMKGHSFGFYMDLQKLIRASAAGGSSANDQAMFDLSAKTWQDVLITGGEWKNGSLSWTAEVNMVDKNTNALKQLNTFIDAAYKARPKYNYEDMQIDTTAVTPADTMATMPPPPPPVK